MIEREDKLIYRWVDKQKENRWIDRWMAKKMDRGKDVRKPRAKFSTN